MAQEANNDVETFASEPGHEHFGQVRQIMAGLVREGKAKNLQDAYDQAVWAHPYVRAELLQQANLARVQDVNKNRRATLSVSGAPGPVAVAPAVDPKDLRATIEAQFSADRV